MGDLTMSEKERRRKAYLEMVKQGVLTLVKAADYLEISYRQVKRIYKKYVIQGDEGLIHKNRGRFSNRGHRKRELIIARYKERYLDFGPTLAAEKLAEDDNLYVDHETLRRWLLKEGLWTRKRKHSSYRQRREPKAQFGEMIQLDGSFHDWFENGREDCLLNFVDDATSNTMSRLEEGETTAGIFRLMWQWIETYGVPMSFYVDLKNVYVSPKQDSFSHVERACKKLGIRIIKAYSPQAKGRVERKHGVYQDRFVKELRLAGIKSIESANYLLNSGFIDKLNKKFAKPARDPNSAHRQFHGDLNQILCWEYERQIQNDWTISFNCKYYQLSKSYGVGIKPKSTINVRKHLDGSISLWYKKHKLSFAILPQRPKKTEKTLTSEQLSKIRSNAGKLSKIKSPWAKFNPGWLSNNNVNTRLASNI
jgi:hypothetical protein